MIRKIQNDEYLKRLGNMTAAEREEYLKRVGEWLKTPARVLLAISQNAAARFQSVLQMCAGWNDVECKAWTDGVKLLTALVATEDTWLPDMLYSKATKRSVKRMVEALRNLNDNLSPNLNGNGNEKQGAKRGPAGEPQGTGRSEAEKKGASNGSVGEGNQIGKEEIKDATEPQGTGTGKTGADATGTVVKSEVKGVPVRPKHIDQYVHLLPVKTQERAGMVRGLLRDMDVARENARRLAEAGESGDKVAQWAKAVTKLDEKVKRIYQELDAEWEKLVVNGMVTVDDLGNAHVASSPENGEAQDSGEPVAEDAGTVAKMGRRKRTEEEKAARQAEKDEKRREYLKKWLRDTRTKPSEERKKMWKKNCEELVKLGGEVTESIRKAGEFYGVKLGVES